MTAIAKILLSALLILFSTAAPNRTYLPIILNQPAPIPTAPPTPTITPTPLPTPTDTPTPMPTATNTPQPGPCLCTSNLYNCSDFSSEAAAQACFNYCVSIGKGDIHGLDENNNGVACESLPLNWEYWR